MTFAERLRELRTEKKMSLNQVAEKIGVGRANIYKYEHGIITNVPPDRVHALANLFGVTRPYLMGWTDDRKANPHENLDMVAERLREQIESAKPLKTAGWGTTGLKEADCITAATQAARALVKFGVSRAPVYPHKVLQQSNIATMVSFADVSELDDLLLNTKLEAIRQANDMVMTTTYTTGKGQSHYIFAVNRTAPIGKIKLVLAEELGHVYLGHTKYLLDTNIRHREAQCFAIHFEYPRALIRLLQEKGFVFTRESFQRIFGDCEWCLDMMLNAGPVTVSPELNRMVKEQFEPHVALLEEAGILSMPTRGEEIDLSKYMAGYVE